MRLEGALDSVIHPDLRRERWNRLCVVDFGEIDGQLAAFLNKDFGETMAEPHVAPRVIAMGLHRGGDYRIDADNGNDENGTTFFERLERGSVKRARFVDGVTQGERRGERCQPVEL